MSKHQCTREAPGTLHQAPGIREAGAGAGGASHAQSVTFPTSMLLKATPLKQIIIQFDSICPTLQKRTAPFHRIDRKVSDRFKVYFQDKENRIAV